MCYTLVSVVSSLHMHGFLCASEVSRAVVSEGVWTSLALLVEWCLAKYIVLAKQRTPPRASQPLWGLTRISMAISLKVEQDMFAVGVGGIPKTTANECTRYQVRTW